jgi:CrcB protein
MFQNFLLVGAGGAVGSMARYGVSFMLSKVTNTELPVATFAINVVGSLCIGILFGLISRNQWLQAGGYLLLASGFCGGFTTFSTFALENATLMQKGQSATALIYTVLSIVVGLLLCRVGMWVAGS